MLTPEELQTIAETMYPALDELNQWITKDVVERFMARMGRGLDLVLSETDKWQLNVYKEAGGHLEAVQQKLQDFLKKSEQEVASIFEDAAIKSMVAENAFYTAQGLSSLKLSENMINILTDSYKRTNGTIKNLTRTTASASEVRFVQVLDNAHKKVISGAESYSEAVREGVMELSKTQTLVTYPTGHKDTIETAVLRAVRTGTAQACGNMTMLNMEERDWDLIRVSAHLGARYGDGGENPGNHFWWQGKLYSRIGKTKGYPLFAETTGYGTGEGLCGWNCRHSFGPGNPNHNPYALFDTEANKKAYDLSQKQRKMERDIRDQKNKLMAIKTAIENCEDPNPKTKMDLQSDYDYAVAKLTRQNEAYTKFCAENNLKQQNERIQLARWGREQAKTSIEREDGLTKFQQDVLSIGKTSTGVELKEVSIHMYSRAEGRGVSANMIKEALTKPINKGKIRADNSQQFRGKEAIVAVNTEKGLVITTWPTEGKNK